MRALSYFGVGNVRQYVAACVSVFALFNLLYSPLLSAVEFDDEYDESPWAEIEIQLPPYPVAENMISFNVGAIAGASFSIDSESLSVGGDGVIRYTLEVVSSSGARNVSYEGMRCKTGEWRFYASGRPDKTWSKARSNQWVRIRGTSNNHHVELFSNYFCPAGSSAVGSAEDARRSLQSGGRFSERHR